MDKIVFEKFLNQKVTLINDEHFLKDGIITKVFDNSIAFFSNGKTFYLSFDRVKELRTGGQQ